MGEGIVVAREAIASWQPPTEHRQKVVDHVPKLSRWDRESFSSSLEAAI